MTPGVPALLAAALVLGGCVTTRPAAVTAAAPAQQPSLYATTWTYGSAEAAALGLQAYSALTNYVAGRLPALQGAAPFESALVTGIDGAGRPQRALCTAAMRAHPAVVLDIDETGLLNSGAQYYAAQGHPYDEAEWARWLDDRAAQPTPVPGAVAAIAALRRLGVTPIWISNATNSRRDATVRALAGAGLGDAVPLETLFLRDDIAPGSDKQPRRLNVAERHCIIAMVGDQVGDFTSLIDAGKPPLASRRAAAAGAYAPLWGQGWFMLPNPVYGAWNTPEATLEDAVPQSLRWHPKPQ
ncbi:HAD family acid phosphatase [Polymorphobacter fuscus]|uniref:Acid phosphatase n=1 Tax=Sandarakinorhabdus fusca TaxID=1439888 RepID=A0A7C9KNW2_9SPHN|nr:HAD family acid phosphatase [Polymorphobacter fuscus]KAB7645596.1 acid phosphatase [Polymorphobacter fuscus]MQT18044.1 acid phosphatase [Polymorphobacter fuscus]NJC08677.1 5'-nucleotidase (lipoprotein e(P4) family) [Polymorphobacter fuscus]